MGEVEPAVKLKLIISLDGELSMAVLTCRCDRWSSLIHQQCGVRIPVLGGYDLTSSPPQVKWFTAMIVLDRLRVILVGQLDGILRVWTFSSECRLGGRLESSIPGTRVQVRSTYRHT